MNNELLYSIGNSLLYLILIYSSYRKRKFLILILSSIWFLSSFASIIYSINPFNFINHKITIIPFLYLYVCFTIGILPFYKFNSDKIKKKSIIGNELLFYSLLWMIAICSYEPLIESLIRILSKGLSNLGSVYEYERKLSGFNTRGYFSPIGNILFSIEDYCKFISIPLLFIYLSTGKKNLFILLGLICAILNPVLNNLANGQRFYTVIVFYSIIFNLALFKNTISQRLKLNILKSIIITFGIIGIIFVSISIARFGKDSSYAVEGYGTTYQFLRYFGEAFYNFNGDVFWIKNNIGGYNTFVGYYTYFQHHTMDIGTMNKVTGITTNNFYTYIGNFYIDYGATTTLYILSLLALFYLMIANRLQKKIKIGTIILFSLYANILLFGTTYFIYQNGFIHMIWSVLVALIFNITTSKRIS